MRKLWEKSEIVFALVWIGIYLAVMNIALEVRDHFYSADSNAFFPLFLPSICSLLLCAVSSVWIFRNGLARHFGLCAFAGKTKDFLWFIPLILMSCTNLTNGLSFSGNAAVLIATALTTASAGYMEEILFRGFLFRGLAKNNLKTAVILSSLAFGAGHFLNLFSTRNPFGVLLQICYTIAVGFLYTLIVWKGGSLRPCIVSHIFVNVTSVFASLNGPFTRLVALIFGRATENLIHLTSAIPVILISGCYALWLWKKPNNFP